MDIMQKLKAERLRVSRFADENARNSKTKTQIKYSKLSSDLRDISDDLSKESNYLLKMRKLAKLSQQQYQRKVASPMQGRNNNRSPVGQRSINKIPTDYSPTLRSSAQNFTHESPRVNRSSFSLHRHLNKDIANNYQSSEAASQVEIGSKERYMFEMKKISFGQIDVKSSASSEENKGHFKVQEP